MPKPDPTELVHEIADIIRVVDGDNKMPAQRLGLEIGRELNRRGYVLVEDQFGDIVARANPDKTLGAARLAERIVEGYWGADVT